MALIKRRKLKRVNLALQGGGSHGAFTWGVLDRLLQEPGLEIGGVSGTSSGAVNAVALACGLARGGPPAARELLASIWQDVSEEVSPSLGASHPMASFESMGVNIHPSLKTLLDFAHMLSPNQMNPLELNPLRNIFERRIDFDQLNTARVQLFISATNVHTGKIRLFANGEINIEALLASVCLPSMQQAVVINGEAYWDGGYAGNPPVFPLIFNCRDADIVVVMLQPLRRNGVPVTAEAIRWRQSELSFNTAFLREMRAIALCKEQIEQGWFPSGRLERRLSRLKLHLIEAEDVMSLLDADSRFNTRYKFLTSLRDEGWARTNSWLEKNLPGVGDRSTIDIGGLFL